MSDFSSLNARTLPVAVLLKMTSYAFRRGYRKGCRHGEVIAKSIIAGEIEATAEKLVEITAYLIVGNERMVPSDELLGIATGLSTELASSLAGRHKSGGGD